MDATSVSRSESCHDDDTPLLFAISWSDLVAIGLVSNLARPGGNVTGTANSVGLEIWGKRIGLLKETLSNCSNTCIIAATLTRTLGTGPYGIWHFPSGGHNPPVLRAGN